MKERPTERQITALLDEKHAYDVFVPQCKDGASFGGTGYAIMDAWVMKRSWSPVTMIGYEIKTSRSDFLQDTKWPKYLDLCHQFSFVTPPGLVEKSEIPPACGWITTTANGNRLYTRVKAPWREIELPVDLLIYILMGRVSVTANGPSSKRGYWQRWLAQRDEDKILGQDVSRCLSRLALERVKKVEHEKETARVQKERTDAVVAALETLGLDLSDFAYYRPVLAQVRAKLLSSVEPLERQVTHVATAIEHVREELERTRIQHKSEIEKMLREPEK